MTYVWSYPKWPLNPRETNIFNSVWIFSIAGSFVALLVITVDRYRAVLSLVRYREVVSWGRTLVITAVVWLYVVVVVILMRVSAFKTASRKTYEWNVNYKCYYAFLAVHIALPPVVNNLCFVLQDLQESGGESPTTFVTWSDATGNYCGFRYSDRN